MSSGSCGRRRLTAHSEAVAEEVACVGYQDDQARLDLGVLVQPGVLEHQGTSQPENHS